ILDLSQIEAGKLTLEPVACSPTDLVTQVTSLMRLRAVRKGLAFGVEYAGPIPARIQVDPTRLRQILLNLLGNAIKFTEVGAVRLRVGLVAEGLRFEVSDTGVGIAPEAQSRLCASGAIPTPVSLTSKRSPSATKIGRAHVGT